MKGKNNAKNEEPAISSEEKKQMLLEGIKKTMLPAFIGTGFAILLFFKFGDAKGVSWFSVILMVVLASYYIQRGLYPLLGVRVKEFGTKDWAYVEFLVIIFMIVIWTLLLN